jgi:hypothetical protein
MPDSYNGVVNEDLNFFPFISSLMVVGHLRCWDAGH